MTDATRREPGASWLSVIWSARHDPAARIFNIDLLTVLIAILLPWSTSGVAIAAVLWFVALIPTIEPRALLRSLMRPISALPIAIVALALVGTLWSDASWGARLHAVSPTAKLLVLPLLFYHFQRSPRGLWVFIAFLASCTLLMVVSWAVAFEPDLTLKPEARQSRGIFVKNYIDQSQEFALCAVALAYPIMMLLRAGRTRLAVLLDAIALSLLANMMFVVVSRTALVTMPIMLAVFALLHLKWRTNLIAVLRGGRAGRAGLGGIAAAAMDHHDVHRGTTRSTRNWISRRRSGCGWNSGRNRCGSLPRPRSSGTAPDRRAGCSSRPRPARKCSPAARSSAIRTIRPCMSRSSGACSA